MSYEIIKKIKITDDNKILITGSSNNVYPRTPGTWEMTYRSAENKINGKLGLEVEILAAYESGTFQGGSNKFVRALSALRRNPEYDKYNWTKRNPRDVARKSSEFYELLAKVLKEKPPKQKYILSCCIGDKKVYAVYRRGGCYVNYTEDINKATKYSYKDQAELLKSLIVHNNSAYTVECLV